MAAGRRVQRGPSWRRDVNAHPAGLSQSLRWQVGHRQECPLDNGAGNEVRFTASGGVIDLFIDNSNDTTLALAGLGVATGNTGDDYRIASAPLTFGEGFATSVGNANGDFSLTFRPVALDNPDGTSFFTTPRPFHITVQSEGQFNFFNPAVGQIIPLQGSADVFFTPEPATVGLLGLALVGAVGVGRAARRSKAVA